MRLLVEELVGPTIGAYFEKFTRDENPEELSLNDVVFASQIFAKSIAMLRELHAIGIVHGDFHYGNLAFRSNEAGGTLDLVFIDFGTAKFFPDDHLNTDYKISTIRYMFFSLNLLSPYQLNGHILGRRDDIYRAFESFVNVLSQGNIERLFDTSPPAPVNKLVDLKTTTDFCSPEDMLQNFQLHDTFVTIYPVLFEIQAYVRDPQKGLAEDPNYAWLLERAHKIIDLLNGE